MGSAPASPAVPGSSERLVGEPAGRPAVGEGSAPGDDPPAVALLVVVDVAAPVVEAVVHDDGEVAPARGVDRVHYVDLMGGHEVPDVVAGLAGRGCVPPRLGAGEDGGDLLEALEALDLPVGLDELHDGIVGEAPQHLLEPARVAVGVVAGDQVPDALSGDQLPELHRFSYPPR